MYPTKKLEKPDISAISRKRIVELVDREDIGHLIFKSLYPKYRYWDEMKHFPIPEDVSAKEIWAVIKYVRQKTFGRRKSVIKAEDGDSFSWVDSFPWYQEFQHQIDMELGGNLFGIAKDMNEAGNQMLMARGIMEEAIASSQLEGANTSRKVAKQMLREGRKPKTTGEQMIYNNYQTMQVIEEEYRHEELSREKLFRLHELLTEKTDIDTDKIGVLREDEDGVVVQDDGHQETPHVPPRRSFVDSELDRFIDYCNDRLPEADFVHPYIKAILIHFWMGYIHPFIDGNGRLARALFYWYMLRNSYWAFSYLPLSQVIKNSWGQYRDAYLYSEQDDYDLTYFIDYNLRKTKQAMDELKKYVKDRQIENSKMAKKARNELNLNDRQIQLIQYFIKNEDASTSVKTHMNINGISRATSVNDLKKLKEIGLLTTKKVGRTVYYFKNYTLDKVFAK